MKLVATGLPGSEVEQVMVTSVFTAISDLGRINPDFGNVGQSKIDMRIRCGAFCVKSPFYLRNIENC